MRSPEVLVNAAVAIVAAGPVRRADLVAPAALARPVVPEVPVLRLAVHPRLELLRQLRRQPVRPVRLSVAAAPRQHRPRPLRLGFMCTFLTVRP